jgi:cell wall-associated NlpC family hydrolase
MVDSDAERAVIVAEAKSFIGTPYHPNGRIKGAGVDCLTLLACVYETLLGPIEVPYYPKDWHLHQTDERYIHGILAWGGAEVDAPPARPLQPADIVLFKFGNCFAHGCIVVGWPVVLHAYTGKKVGTVDLSGAHWLTKYFENIPEKGQERPRRFYTLKRWL